MAARLGDPGRWMAGAIRCLLVRVERLERQLADASDCSKEKKTGASDSSGTYFQVCCERRRHVGVAGSVSPGGVVGACAPGAAGDRAPEQG